MKISSSLQVKKPPMLTSPSFFADLVPPCGPLTGVDSGGQGTDQSNPDLYQRNVIRMHQGITGVADLDPAIHDFEQPVAEVTITRTS